MVYEISVYLHCPSQKQAAASPTSAKSNKQVTSYPLQYSKLSHCLHSESFECNRIKNQTIHTLKFDYNSVNEKRKSVTTFNTIYFSPIYHRC